MHYFFLQFLDKGSVDSVYAWTTITYVFWNSLIVLYFFAERA